MTEPWAADMGRLIALEIHLAFPTTNTNGEAEAMERFTATKIAQAITEAVTERACKRLHTMKEYEQELAERDAALLHASEKLISKHKAQGTPNQCPICQWREKYEVLLAKVSAGKVTG